MQYLAVKDEQERGLVSQDVPIVPNANLPAISGPLIYSQKQDPSQVPNFGGEFDYDDYDDELSNLSEDLFRDYECFSDEDIDEYLIVKPVEQVDYETIKSSINSDPRDF